MGNIIGIDLGTTTSEIAYIKNGRPEIIEDTTGHRIIPSVVSYDIKNNEIFAGNKAYNTRVSNAENTIQEIKRHMGEDYKVKLNGDDLYPHEVSAIILSELKKYAEDRLGEKIDEAVITVPANFTNQQREATKEAGKLAGLRVERIINEPTAAAMAYGIDNLDKEANILVYDLGGGTFDVTVLELYKGVLDVKASRGNNLLGGKDFDAAVEKYILNEFRKEYGVDLYEIKGINKVKAEGSIKAEAKRVKEELSFQEIGMINIPFLAVLDGEPIGLDIELTRGKFERLTKDLVESTREPVKEALEASNLNYEDIDIVLTVGGSSRIAAVQKLVEELFPGKVRHDINPDEAVAMGAAIQAGIKTDQIDSKKSLVVTDKCNYNLGTRIVGNLNGRLIDDLFDCIIPVDSSIPCSKTKRYYTCSNGQQSVIIDVYEGYNELASKNEKISEFSMDGIPSAPAGEEAIDINFTYDLNGTLEVIATIVSTGKKANKKVVDKRLEIKSTGNLSKYLTSEPIKVEETNSSNSNSGVNLNAWKDSSLASIIKRTIELAEMKLDKLNNSDSDKVINLLNELKQAAIDENEDLVDELDEKLTDLLFEL
ncbi:Hsp70 family protein [Peptacetobacter hiranonis]|uniref:Hsp70 family protein n=1 Tax=Peptacetobacter hiranonis TaxID=89152 RepID=UPI0022E2AA25|nr:Hsp70 family protein [Peptacetobacter hiranonis]